MRQPNTDSFAYGNSDGNGYIHSDGYRNGNAYANTDGNSNCNLDSHSNGYSNCHNDRDCDGTATTYTHASASADTVSAPVAFFGVKGTRENKLASSQPK